MIRLVDTNVIVRLLTKDDPLLFSKALKVFEDARAGKSKIYLDEIVIAETLWVLLSHYNYEKIDVCPKLIKMLSSDWIVNPRKKILLDTLTLYNQQNFSFVDCWAYCFSRELKLSFETFDKKLKKLKV